MDPTSPSPTLRRLWRPGNPSPGLPLWLLVVAVVWILGFLAVFFNEPLHGPELKRSDLWLMLADEFLGFDISASAESSDTPAGHPFLSQRLPLCGWAIVILGLAAVHGLAVLQLLPLRTGLLKTETAVIVMGTGLPILSLLTLVCGTAGQLHRTSLILLSLPSLMTAIFARNRQSPQAGPAVLISAGRASKMLRLLVVLVVVPFVGYLLLGAMSPPTDFDVREYHLQGPKEWFQQGRITFLRHNVYTSFPFLSEMLLLDGMVFSGHWWEGALVGQLVLSCFQPLSACAVFAICRRWINASVAWLAVLIYLTTPWTLRISLIAYAEGALTFYLTASAMAALWVLLEGVSLRSVLILCGLFSGSAMASKYTGLVTVIVPVAVLLAWALLRRERTPPSESSPSAVEPDRYRRLAQSAGWFALGIFLMMAPWLLRNLTDTGNPVYPLGYSIFGGTEWSAEMNARWKPAHASSEHLLSELPRHFLDAAVRNMWTSGLLFSLAVPATFWWRRSQMLTILLCLTGWSFFAWWAFTHRIDRFWIPAIPLLSMTAAFCWQMSDSAVWRGFLGIVIAVVTAANLQFCSLALVGFHAGLMDLQTARQLTIRADLRMLNETLPESARVLLVGEAEVFDATFPLVYNTVFDDSIFAEWTMDPSDATRPAQQRRMLPADEIRDRFQKERITHVHVHWGEILRYRLPGSYGYDEYIQPAKFETLVRQGILKPAQIMLAQPLSSMSNRDLATVRLWDGFESLLMADQSFAVVQVFEVANAD